MILLITSISSMIVLYVLFAVFVILLLIALSSKKIPISRWHHSYDTFAYSSKDLYKSIEKWISEREIPGVSMSHISRVEGSILGARREYLRIEREEFRFDICAAPFGTGFFVSWWLIQKVSFLKRLMKRSPQFAELSDMKTYYQWDTETMFKEYVHMAITKALDEMTNDKGFRLTEADKNVIDLKK